MTPPARPAEVRGARDLVALWRALPAAALGYPAAAVPPDLGLSALGDTLRARAWREHCAAPALASCADLGHSCAQAGSGPCLADALFPMRIGGGAPSWRMVTLVVQWRPALAQLRLIALGQTARGMLGWAARCLHGQHGLVGAEPLPVVTLGDLEPTGAARWRLTFVTPWLVGKNLGGTVAAPDAAAVARELRKAIRTSAHKLTALCARDETWQRIGAHLAHHVAEALLPGGLAVEEVRVEAQPLDLASRGNAARFQALTWSGEVVLRVDEAVLPWLGLVAIRGGGENADKGFGGVELTPLS
jgi:hypothetical protein